jgi:ubiquitin C-terminal hydrolase
MQAPLVFRPFASNPNEILTWRDRRLDPSSSPSSRFWDSTALVPDSTTYDPSLLDEDQIASRESALDDAETSTFDPKNKYPGLINTGNFCFMNSVLQALASLPEFQSYLDTIDDGPDRTPVTSALVDLLRQLNTPRRYATALHPDNVARALMQSDKHRLLATREQQDAQEFFALLLDTLESESTRQWLVINKRPGLESLAPLLKGNAPEPEVSCRDMSSGETFTPSPFDGLSAHRMGCLKCKYVENIRHEKFGPMVLPLSMATYNLTLGACLEDAFEMESLDEVECQKCTLLAYRQSLSNLLAALGRQPSPPQDILALTTARIETIDRALQSGKLDDPSLFGSSEIKKFIRRSTKTKHSMIARPPRLAAFHIQRSNYQNFTGRAMKNQAPVSFPLTLDVSRYVTNSVLSMDPEEPISTWRAGIDGRTVYRLRSVIVHYGLHHIGHYVAYRCVGDEWFRISDEDVESATLEEVLKDGARGVFMLMYELVRYDDEGKTDITLSPLESHEGITLALDSASDSSDDVQSLPDTDDEGTPSKPTSELSSLETKLEATHISPPKTITPRSENPVTISPAKPSVRPPALATTSIHSRPRTPIFEVKDPQMSPPPLKKIRTVVVG